FANNPWLQELPKPLTRLTWGNAALLSPATAAKLGLTASVGWHGGEHGELRADVVELRLQGRSLRAPALVVPGHADDVVTLTLGYGRLHAGRHGSGIGASANALRRAAAPWSEAGVEIQKTGETQL